MSQLRPEKGDPVWIFAQDMAGQASNSFRSLSKMPMVQTTTVIKDDVRFVKLIVGMPQWGANGVHAWYRAKMGKTLGK